MLHVYIRYVSLKWGRHLLVLFVYLNYAKLYIPFVQYCPQELVVFMNMYPTKFMYHFPRQLLRYKHFSAGLLSPEDPVPDHSRHIDEQYMKDDHNSSFFLEGSKDPSEGAQLERERHRLKVWSLIAKKEVPKMAKMFAMARHNVVTNNKKVGQKNGRF